MPVDIFQLVIFLNNSPLLDTDTVIIFGYYTYIQQALFWFFNSHDLTMRGGYCPG